MHIQPVKYRVEINGLSTLLHPLDHTCNMVTPESHAHQFLNQLIVGMVADELRLVRISDHEIKTWWRVLKGSTCWGISRLSKMRLGWMMCSSSLTIIHHVCTTRWRKRREVPGRSIHVSWGCRKRALHLLGWRLLWNCSSSSSISIRYGIGTVRSLWWNSRVWHLHGHAVWQCFCR